MSRTLAIILTIGAVAAGCGTSSPCDSNPALCEDGGQGSCTGQCAPVNLEAQPFRVMMWSGPEGTTPPACPAAASANHVPGYLDTPPSEVTCTDCTCSPSVNLCSPSGTMNASGAACPATGVPMQPFNGPSVWDGTCTAMDPASSADSVTVAPPALDGLGQCTAANTSVVQFSGGPTIALLCNSLPGQNDVPGACPSPDQVCTYPDAPGFLVCTQTMGDVPCPPTWPTKHLLFEEDLACTCACSQAGGELCSATVTAYEDSACSKPLGSVMATSSQPAACFDVPVGSTLGSKSAALSYTPGSCDPLLTKLQTSTLCCLPSP